MPLRPDPLEIISSGFRENGTGQKKKKSPQSPPSLPASNHTTSLLQETAVSCAAYRFGFSEKDKKKGGGAS